MYRIVYQLSGAGRSTYHSLADAISALLAAQSAQTDDCQSIWIERADGAPLSSDEHKWIETDIARHGALSV